VRRGLWGNRAFVALCGARSVSAIGDQVAAVALVLLIARDHPATAVGGLLLAESLPMLLSTHAGLVADRFEIRSLMIACQIVQGVIFGLVTAWLPPYGILLGLLVIASLFGTVLRSATQRGVAELVPNEQLMGANALLGMALWLGMMLGPALGGALSGLAGPRLALAVDTGSFAISAATLLVLPRLPARTPDESDSGGVAAALRYAMRDPILRALMIAMTLMVAFAGIDNVGLVFLVRDTLGHGATAYGVAMAIFGVGMVTGSALLVRFTTWPAERTMVAAHGMTALATLLLGVAPGLALVFVAQVVGGGANGMDVAAQTTIVQRRTPPAMLGRMSGAINSSVAVGFLIAYLGGGALVDALGPRTAFVIAGVGTALSIGVLRPLWRSVPTRRA
jgi:MFS family permease